MDKASPHDTNIAWTIVTLIRHFKTVKNIWIADRSNIVTQTRSMENINPINIKEKTRTLLMKFQNKVFGFLFG